jgi:recombination protein RecR
MSKFAEPMSRLIDELKKLPGVGSKSAQRLAFHILRASDDDAEALAAAVRDVKASLRLCSVCNNITDVDPCVYCTSATRNQRLVCVVEEPTNIAAIEKTKHFNGVYHVLHGSLSPLHGVGPEQLRIANLIARVDAGNVDEVIVATNPTVEGEATSAYLSQQLKRVGVKVTRIANLIARVDAGNVDEVIVATNPTVEGEATSAYLSQQLKRVGVKVTRIAMGIPVGSDIEYTDEITMLKAIEGRREL